MDIEKLKRVRLEQDGLSKTLGMDFISTPEPDTCMARMKVGRHNRQVFGFLSGGATLALAENLAGIGSMALSPGKICLGINVTGNHMKAVLEGDDYRMIMTTDLPAVQLYTAVMLTSNEPGKGGKMLEAFNGVALETEFFPDAPNRPDFQCVFTEAGKPFETTTVYQLLPR